MKQLLIAGLLVSSAAFGADRVTVTGGTLEGSVGKEPSIRVFRGVPFAAPPIGPLRWAPPQPVVPWKDLRKADKFGGHCVQAQLFDDILFQGEMSEDCLYLTVWTPAKSARERLPVYIWFYGGGFAAGAGDEPRYDGESFAKQGIVVVNVNYRLGVFGFFSHPELTNEASNKASGNYGLLDQVAGLKWVKKNIAAFGGDPRRITIGGESAGSLSVSALMASPLSRDLFQQAIGESGGFFSSVGGRGMMQLPESEKQGQAFAASAGAKTLSDLRAMPSADLLRAASRRELGLSFWPSVDGYFLPDHVERIFTDGKQSSIPLLAGWNADEVRARVSLAKQKPNVVTFTEQLRQQFKDRAPEALKVYPAQDDEQALRSAGDLASDNFIVHGTWKWIEMQTRTNKPVFRFQFDRDVPIPELRKSMGVKTLGAAHAAELEYVFQTFEHKKADWQPEDQKLGSVMSAYWGNFIKKGNPNGPELPEWREFGKSREVMHLNVESHSQTETDRERHEFLDSVVRAAGSRD